MDHFEATKERGGDGTLSEVVDNQGRVVSPYPMSYTAAVRYAEFRNADSRAEHDALLVTERE